MIIGISRASEGENHSPLDAYIIALSNNFVKPPYFEGQKEVKMKNAYIIKHLFSGPDNISINQLTESDLRDILSALKIAEMSIPKETTQILSSKIETFLEIHGKGQRK